MGKRAIDLSVEELAAIGAKAARAAAQESQRAGLTITGSVTIHEKDQAASVLAQLLPSGTVTFVRNADETEPHDLSEADIAKPGKAAD